MRFSISKLVALTAFVAFAFAATFAMPFGLGFVLLSIVSVLVLPPVVVVGAAVTRGRQQAFFLGTLVSGVTHYVVSVYLGVTIAMVMMSGDLFSGTSGLEDELGPAKYMHLTGYVVGAIGGAMGALTHWFLVPTRSEEDPTSRVARPNADTESESDKGASF